MPLGRGCGSLQLLSHRRRQRRWKGNGLGGKVRLGDSALQAAASWRQRVTQGTQVNRLAQERNGLGDVHVRQQLRRR